MLQETEQHQKEEEKRDDSLNRLLFAMKKGVQKQFFDMVEDHLNPYKRKQTAVPF